MNLATGLLALMLLGSDGPGGPVEKGLRYEVRILEMPGVEWRGALHETLEPITHDGRVCAWTMPREFSAKLTQSALNEIATPSVTGLENTSSVVKVGHSQPFVSHLTRFADGPVGHAHAIAMKPTIERAENALKIQVQGRRLDQGVLARVEIADSRVDRMLSYNYKEEVQGINGPVTLCAKAEVPQVSSLSVEGEWLIPSDDVLVVSMGLHTKAGKDGKAETMERVALVDVRIADRAPVAFRGLPEGLPPLPIAPSGLFNADAQHHPVKVKGLALKPIEPILPAGTMPTPPPPSRDLPTAINHKGEIVDTEVPDGGPLPEPDESAEPRATPQSLVKPGPTEAPAPSASTDQAALRKHEPNHTEPFLSDYYQELFSSPPAPMVKDAGPSIRIEPRINFEIHLKVPELSVASLADVGQALPRLGDLSTLMAKAVGAYAASDDRNDGALCVFDMVFPIGKSVKSRVSVLVESERKPRAKTDGSATPVRFDPKDSCPNCPSVKPDDPASSAPASEPEGEGLTLGDAIRLGLQHTHGRVVLEAGRHRVLLEPLPAWLRHTHGLVVLEAGSMSSPTVIAPASDQAPERMKADLLREVRTIEEQYWALSGAQAGFRASEELLSMAREVVRKHRASWSKNDRIEAEEAIHRFELGREHSRERWKGTELSLRAVLGLPASGPSLVAVSRPSSRKITPDWEQSLKSMLTTNPEARAHPSDGVVRTRHEAGEEGDVDRYAEGLRKNLIHQMARVFLELDTNQRLYETAKRLRTAALTRLVILDAEFQNGKVAPGRYLDALNRWSSAVAQEADFVSRYNASLAAFEELKGTLLDRDGVKVGEGKTAKADHSAVRTAFKTVSGGKRHAIEVIVGPVWNGPLATASRIRIPLSPVLSVGVRVVPETKPGNMGK